MWVKINEDKFVLKIERLRVLLYNEEKSKLKMREYMLKSILRFVFCDKWAMILDLCIILTDFYDEKAFWKTVQATVRTYCDRITIKFDTKNLPWQKILSEQILKLWNYTVYVTGERNIYRDSIGGYK